jgi:molybdopterin molybdotransferase
VTPDQVFQTLASFERVGLERVELQEALHRVLGEDVAAGEDLPPFPRATMDGFAVKAEDTFGASDSLPALLSVAGAVEMGFQPDFVVGKGQAAEIPTGGFLPSGADAVVMVEYTNCLGDGTVEVTRPVTSGENVLGRAEDVAQGAVLLKRGWRLRPQDIGMLAGLGRTQVEVFRRPTVVVASTGNEIVPITETPAPGQIRDINSYSVSALVKGAGAMPVLFGVVPDEAALLREALLRGIAGGDVLVVSGGSSVGERDLMVHVVGSLPESEILVHGVAVSPGKPTLLARVKGKALFGLPGHPVSALLVARVFLLPFLAFVGGDELKPKRSERRVEARLGTSVPSVQGREEYVRVRLEERDGQWIAWPVFGKSSMLSTMVRSDGLFRIPIHAEGIAEGERVEVILF